MILIAAWMVWLIAPASASDCTSAYTVDVLLGDLVQVEEFLRNGDDAASGTAGQKLEEGLGCLGEILPAMIAGRSYRAVGASLVASGNTERGAAWFRTATEIDQSFDYGLEDLPEDHPIRGVYSSAKSESGGEKVVVDGMDLSLGTNYLDGRKIDKPTARLDRPHVYQRDDGGVKSWVIEGNAFPVEVLAASVAVAAVVETAGKGKAPKVKEPKVKEPKVKEPKEPKVKEPKEPTVKEPKEPTVKEPKEPTVKEPSAKEPKVKEPKEPKEKESKEPKRKPSAAPGVAVAVSRQRPPEKTPLILAGGLVIGGAGAVYLMALNSRGKFEDAETLDEITRLQPLTNRLVIVSAATLAVGAGTFTWGVILDGSTPVPAVKFRF